MAKYLTLLGYFWYVARLSHRLARRHRRTVVLRLFFNKAAFNRANSLLYTRRVDRHEFTAAEMERLAQRIKTARLDLIRFMHRLGYYPALLRTQPDSAPE